MALESYKYKDLIEAGCDEAGRGSLAGPVFAAAVILPKDFYHPLLNDSKKMSKKNREILRKIIKEQAISYAVVAIDAEEIDKINILNASIKAMQEAVKQLDTKAEILLIDGNRFKDFENYKYETIIKGDSKYSCIAAASVLAKTYRDEYMENLAKDFPQYAWEKNMGYPSKAHIQAIKENGRSIYHRKSYRIKSLDEPMLF